MDCQFINFIVMEMQKETYGFKKEFDYLGTHYSMHVIPFITARDNDKNTYHLEEGQFLIHLFDGLSFQTFSVFYNERLEWDTNVSKLILDDKLLIERIGFLIDDYYA